MQIGNKLLILVIMCLIWQPSISLGKIRIYHMNDWITSPIQKLHMDFKKISSPRISNLAGVPKKNVYISSKKTNKTAIKLLADNGGSLTGTETKTEVKKYETGQQILKMDEIVPGVKYCLKAEISNLALEAVSKGDEVNVVQGSAECGVDSEVLFELVKGNTDLMYSVQSSPFGGFLKLIDNTEGVRFGEKNGKLAVWKFEQTSDAEKNSGVFMLRNQETSNVLAVKDGSSEADAALVAVAKKDDDKSQQFKLYVQESFEVTIHHQYEEYTTEETIEQPVSVDTSVFGGDSQTTNPNLEGRVELDEEDSWCKGMDANEKKRIRTANYIVEKPEHVLDNGVYCIKVKHSKKMIGLTDKNDTDMNIYQMDTTCGPKSQFRFLRKRGKGNRKMNVFRIESEINGQVMSIDPSGKKRQPVSLTTCDANNQLRRQTWTMSSVGNNFLFYFRNNNSKFWLEVKSGLMDKYQPVIGYKKNHEYPSNVFNLILIRMLPEKVDIVNTAVVQTSQKKKKKKSSVKIDVKKGKKKPKRPKQKWMMNDWRINDMNNVDRRAVYCLKSEPTGQSLILKIRKAQAATTTTPAKPRSKEIIQKGNKCKHNSAYRIIRLEMDKDEAQIFRIYSMKGKGNLTISTKDEEISSKTVYLSKWANAANQKWRMVSLSPEDKSNESFALENFSNGYRLELSTDEASKETRLIAVKSTTDEKSQRFSMTVKRWRWGWARRKWQVRGWRVNNFRRVNRNSFYCIRNVKSKKLLMTNGAENSAANVFQKEGKCVKSAQFRFIRSGKAKMVYRIRSRERKGVMTVGDVSDDGVDAQNVYVKKWGKSNNQRWKLFALNKADRKEGRFHLQSLKNQYQIEIKDGSADDNAGLVSYQKKNIDANQKFTVSLRRWRGMPKKKRRWRVKGYRVRSHGRLYNQGVYCIRSLFSNRIVNRLSRKNGDGTKNDDKRLYQQTKKCSRLSRFRFIRHKKSKNVFRIRSAGIGKVITQLGSENDVNEVELQKWAKKDSQLWRLTRGSKQDKAKGRFRLVNVKTKYKFDLLESKKTKGNKMISFKNRLAGNAQKFSIKLMGWGKLRRYTRKWRKRGWRVRYLNRLTSRSDYCVRSAESKKTLMVKKKGVKDDSVYQIGEKCRRQARWRFVRSNKGKNVFRIRSVERKTVISVNVDDKDSQGIYVKKWNKSESQLWRVFALNKEDRKKGLFHMENLESKYQIDSKGETDGNGVSMTSYKHKSAKVNQKFFINLFKWRKRVVKRWRVKGYRVTRAARLINRGVYCMKAFHSKMRLGVKKDTEDANLYQMKGKCNRYSGMRLLKIKGKKGVYRIRSQAKKGVLTVNDDEKNLQKVFVGKWNKKVSQMWRMKASKKSNKKRGVFTFTNVKNRYRLDVRGGAKAKEMDMIVYKTAHDKGNQEFTLRLMSIVKKRVVKRWRVKGYRVTRSARLINRGVYCMKAFHSKMRLGVKKDKEDANLYQMKGKCNRLSGMRILKIKGKKNIFRIRNQAKKGVLTINSNDKDMQKVHISKWTKKKGQMWRMKACKKSNKKRGVFTFTNIKNKYMLDVRGGAKKKEMDMVAYKTAHNNGSQEFTISLMNILKKRKRWRVKGYRVTRPARLVNRGVYCMKAFHSKMRLGVKKDKEDANLYQMKGKCGKRSGFRFLKIKGKKNVYRIRNMVKKGALTITSNDQNLQKVFVGKWNKKVNQMWRMKASKKSNKKRGVFTFTNLKNRYVLDVRGGAKNKEMDMIAYKTAHDKGNQEFTISLMRIIKKRKRWRVKGYRVSRITRLEKRGVYCMKALHSKMRLGVKKDEQDSRMYQLKGKCNRYSGVRFLRIKGKKKGVFRIRSIIKKGVLTVKSNNNNDLQKVHFSKWQKKKKAQMWQMMISKKSNKKRGVFTFTNIKNRYRLDVRGGAKTEETDIVSFKTKHNNGSQEFSISLMKFSARKLTKRTTTRIVKKDPKPVCNLTDPDSECNLHLHSLYSDFNRGQHYCISPANSVPFDSTSCLFNNNFRFVRLKDSKNLFRIVLAFKRNRTITVDQETNNILIQRRSQKVQKFQTWRVTQQRNGSYLIFNLATEQYLIHSKSEQTSTIYDLELSAQGPSNSAAAFIVIKKSSFEPRFKSHRLFCIKFNNKSSKDTLIPDVENSSVARIDSECNLEDLWRLVPAQRSEEAYYLVSAVNGYTLSEGKERTILLERNKFLNRQQWLLVENDRRMSAIINLQTRMSLTLMQNGELVLKPADDVEDVRTRYFRLKGMPCPVTVQ